MSETVNIKILASVTGQSDATSIRATVSRKETLQSVNARVFPEYPTQTNRIRWIYLGRTIESMIPDSVSEGATIHVSITTNVTINNASRSSVLEPGPLSALDQILLSFINSVCVILFALLWRHHWAHSDQFSHLSTALLICLSAILLVSIKSQFR